MAEIRKIRWWLVGVGIGLICFYWLTGAYFIKSDFHRLFPVGLSVPKSDFWIQTLQHR